MKVWLTKDQQVIILHGEHNGYITTIEKKKDLIVNFEYSELKTKVHLPNGDYIPTLEEYLMACKGKLRVNIELKGKNLELLNKVFPILQKTKMLGSIGFSSFHHPFYERFLDLKRNLKIKEEICFGFLMWKEEECKQFFGKMPKRFNENKNSVNLEITILLKFRWIREKVKELKQKGITVAIYYPFVLKETFQNCRFLSDLGVDTAICNDPMVIKKFNGYFD
jgi:glycerophosphoryl diester phosphodiesterase